MLHFDVVRGGDSTGVAAISQPSKDNCRVEVFKSLGSPSEFFTEHRKFVKSNDITTSPVHTFLGHNRYATQGGVSVDTAHPFDFENVVGVHNGTVDQWSLRKFDGYKEFKVDSQIIYSHLSGHTIDDVWADADGAMALVWWDKVRENLKIIRNAERPMSIVYTEDNKTVFFGSELGMIYLAAHRNQIRLKDPVAVPPNRLFVFGVTKEGLSNHFERDLPPFVAKPVYYQRGQNNWVHAGFGAWEDWDDEWMNGTTEPKTGPVLLTPPPQPPAADPVGTQKMLSIQEWNENGLTSTATAFTADGTPVRVVIGASEINAAKGKIKGRGVGNGYYLVPKLFNSPLPGQGQWCHWRDLKYFGFVKGTHMIRKGDNSFEIHSAVQNEPDYAPWFGPNNMLTAKAWVAQTRCGCMNCQKKPFWAERKDLLWTDKETFFCKDCQELDEVKEVLQEFEEQKRSA